MESENNESTGTPIVKKSRSVTNKQLKKDLRGVFANVDSKQAILTAENDVKRKKEIQKQAQENLTKVIRVKEGRIKITIDGKDVVFAVVEKQPSDRNFRKYSKYCIKMVQTDVSNNFIWLCGICNTYFPAYASSGSSKTQHYQKCSPELVEIWEREAERNRLLIHKPTLDQMREYKLDSTYQELYSKSKESAELVNQRAMICAMWMAENSRPYNMLKDHYLKVLIHHAQCITRQGKYGLAHIPSDDTVKRKVKFLADEGRKNTRSFMNTSVLFYSITSDLWTSISNKSFIGITVNFITPEMEMFSKLLSTEYFPQQHTARNIKECYLEVMKKYNLRWSRCVSATTDSGANIKKAFEDLKVEKEASFIALPTDPKMISSTVKIERSAAPIYGRFACFAHVIHLVVTTVTTKSSLKGLRSKIAAWNKSQQPEKADLEATLAALANDCVQCYQLADLDLDGEAEMSTSDRIHTSTSNDEGEEALGLFKRKKAKEFKQIFQYLVHYDNSEKILEQITFIRQILKKVRKVVTYFNKSSTAFAEFQKIKVKDKCGQAFKQEVCTRWNSTYKMLERFLENKEYLRLYEKKKIDQLSSGLRSNPEKVKRACGYRIIPESDFKYIKAFKSLLNPFDTATSQLSHSTRATATSCYIVFNDLLASIKETGEKIQKEFLQSNKEVSDCMINLSSFMQDLLKNRYSDVKNIVYYSLFLDFRACSLIENDQTLKNKEDDAKRALFNLWFNYAKETLLVSEYLDKEETFSVSNSSTDISQEQENEEAIESYVKRQFSKQLECIKQRDNANKFVGTYTSVGVGHVRDSAGNVNSINNQSNQQRKSLGSLDSETSLEYESDSESEKECDDVEGEAEDSLDNENYVVDTDGKRLKVVTEAESKAYFEKIKKEKWTEFLKEWASFRENICEYYYKRFDPSDLHKTYYRLGPRADPLLYWKSLIRSGEERQQVSRFPMMRIVARACLTILATSVECERLFSRAGLIYAARRSAITPAHANDLLQAYDYIKFMKKDSTSQRDTLISNVLAQDRNEARKRKRESTLAVVQQKQEELRKFME